MGVVTDGTTALPVPAEDCFLLRDDAAMQGLLEGQSAAAVQDSERLAPLRPETLAYVLYTSVSTGAPKGVMVGHRELAHYASFADGVFARSAEEVVLFRTTLGFDYSAEELWWTLGHGHRLVVVSEVIEGDPPELLALADRSGATSLVVVPSLLSELAAGDGLSDLPRLRQVLCGGEALTSGHAAAVSAAREIAGHVRGWLTWQTKNAAE